jgi:OTU-like cysteine protease
MSHILHADYCRAPRDGNCLYYAVDRAMRVQNPGKEFKIGEWTIKKLECEDNVQEFKNKVKTYTETQDFYNKFKSDDFFLLHMYNSVVSEYKHYDLNSTKIKNPSRMLTHPEFMQLLNQWWKCMLPKNHWGNDFMIQILSGIYGVSIYVYKKSDYDEALYTRVQSGNFFTFGQSVAIVSVCDHFDYLHITSQNFQVQFIRNKSIRLNEQVKRIEKTIEPVIEEKLLLFKSVISYEPCEGFIQSQLEDMKKMKLERDISVENLAKDFKSYNMDQTVIDSYNTEIDRQEELINTRYEQWRKFLPIFQQIVDNESESEANHLSELEANLLSESLFDQIILIHSIKQQCEMCSRCNRLRRP